ncbi:hypothetical protein HMPREF3156_01346 [Neisseria sp. HMSC06F02]|nr:hypothetical protein HMPREF3156_01346 [Neisseria sp. HMSC06F02]
MRYFSDDLRLKNTKGRLKHENRLDCLSLRTVPFEPGIKPAGCVHSRKVIHKTKPDFKIIHICKQGKQQFIRILN